MRLLAFSARDLLGAATAQYTPRTATADLHVSEVIKDLAQTQRTDTERARFAKPAEAGDQLKWAVGLAFEEILLKAFGDADGPLYDPEMTRPGEIRADGLVGTPDWLTIKWVELRAGVPASRREVLVVGESKAT